MASILPKKETITEGIKCRIHLADDTSVGLSSIRLLLKQIFGLSKSKAATLVSGLNSASLSSRHFLLTKNQNGYTTDS